MPPRLISLLIILCWLGMGAWLFLRDLWPRWRPGEPPAYTFMAADEAPRQGPPVRWNVFHNGQHAYDLEARTIYHDHGDNPAEDDSFEMQVFLRVKQQPGMKAPVRRLRGFVHVTRDGALRAVNAQLHLAIRENWECLFDIEGVVADGQLLPRWRIRIWPYDNDTEARVFDRLRTRTQAMLREVEVPFKPVEFTDHGIILNPLQPPNRLDALRPGQHWRMPLAGNLLVLETLGNTLHAAFNGNQRLDGMIDMVYGTLGRALDDVPMLEAHVLANPEQLPAPLGDSLPTAGEPPLCWVIEASDEEGRVHGRMWIQKSDGDRKGLVLRQEVVLHAEQGDETWIVQRER